MPSPTWKRQLTATELPVVRAANMSPRSSDDTREGESGPWCPLSLCQWLPSWDPVSGPWQVPASVVGGSARGLALHCLLALGLPLKDGLP